MWGTSTAPWLPPTMGWVIRTGIGKPSWAPQSIVTLTTSCLPSAKEVTTPVCGARMTGFGVTRAGRKALA
ncbi:MAG: hypothetical protein IPN17_38270 [Deltaproteobacteria bacterium]|nr:hypothetical protein [Deltaproteobacteria bacterium]